MSASAILCLVAFLGAEDVSPAVTTTPDLELRQIEQNIITLTNLERSKRGLSPLQVDPKLLNSARKHASWMANRRVMHHSHSGVAENIAYGQRSSEAVLRSWMNSSGHRANILNRSYKRIGVAAFRTPGGTIYWCQQFLR